MMLGWVQSDGVGRMRMIGVVPTSLSVRCISWDLLVYYRVKVKYYPSCFWNNVTMKNHWRGY